MDNDNQVNTLKRELTERERQGRRDQTRSEPSTGAAWGGGLPPGGDGGVLRGAGILRERDEATAKVPQNPDSGYRSGSNQVREPTIGERIRWAVERGRNEMDRYQKACRAAELLERHPEAAELWELLRQF